MVRDTVELAGLLGVPIVVLMSGLPGGAPGERTSLVASLGQRSGMTTS